MKQTLGFVLKTHQKIRYKEFTAGDLWPPVSGLRNYTLFFRKNLTLKGASIP